MSEDKKLERFLLTVTTNWCVTTIEDFNGDIKYYVDAAEDAHIIDTVSVNLFTSQTVL